MRRTMTVKGLQRLERRLRQIPADVRVAIRESMAKTADEIVARMKRKVAEDTGTLESTIAWTWGNAPKGTIGLVQARADSLRAEDTITIFAGGPPTTKRVGNRTYERSVAIGSGDTRGIQKKAGGANVEYDYALAVEFGTKQMPAQPFFYVTWKQMKRAARSRQRKAMREGIAVSSGA